MRRILAALSLAACILSVPAGTFAADRTQCLQACEDEAVACETERCGVGDPPVDTTCGRVCGDRYKQCKANCPQ